MKKLILCIITITIGLTTSAFSWVNNPYSPYPNVNPAQVVQPVDYNTVPPYGQPYPQTYIQTPYQTPYQTQCQYPGQYVNPYTYQRYGYGNNIVSPIINSVTGLGVTNGTNQIVRNIGRSMFYSMLRGY